MRFVTKTLSLFSEMTLMIVSTVSTSTRAILGQPIPVRGNTKNKRAHRGASRADFISTRCKIFWKIAFLAFAAVIFAAQPRALGQGLQAPNGEAITHGFDGGFTTATTVFNNGFDEPGVFTILPPIEIWEAPGTITAIVKKTKDVIIVVVGNKLVYELTTLNNGKTKATYVGYIGSPGSEGIGKVVGDALYAFSYLAVYVSRDTGSTWQTDTTGLGPGSASDIAVDTAQFVYAATGHGLFKQNPDSNTWHQVTTLTQATNLYRVFVDRKNRILVGGNSGGVYLSTNNGTTWSVDTAGIGTQSANLFADDVYGNLYVVTNNPFTNVDHIFKSSGGTSSWQEIDGPINSIAVNNIAINALTGDSVLYAGTSFGLFVSTDQGTTWSLNNNGIAAEYFSGFLKSLTGKWFTGTSLGLYSKKPSDTSWTKVYPVNGYSGNISFAGDGLGNIYASSSHTTAGGPIIFKSTDNGASWNPDTAGVSLLRTGVFFVDEAGGQHLGTSQYGSSYPTLMYTRPLGGSWTLDTVGFSSINYSFTFSISSDKHGYLYITGYYYKGTTQVNARVMRRPIGGGTWMPDTNGLGGSVNYLSNLGPDKNGNMMGEAGISLYKRTNGTWGTISLPSRAAAGFYYIDKFSVDSSGAIFASFSNFSTGGGGIYFTTDGGTSWTYAGLDSLTVNQLISYGDSTYVSTSNGLYILTRNSIGTAVRASITPPAIFALEQNYPNPFNPATNVRFTIGSAQLVTLKIYDVLGREVSTLIHEKLNAGSYTVPWNAINFSSGVYFYQLKAGTFVETKKMILMK